MVNEPTSTLSAALTAAQAKAIAALEKAYVAGQVEQPEMLTLLSAMGATDTVDQERLLVALDTLRQYGATPPTPQNGPTDSGARPMTNAQRSFLTKLFDEKGYVAPAELDTWTRDKASEAISQLQAGTYTDDVPF